jgi:hypothetical protein
MKFILSFFTAIAFVILNALPIMAAESVIAPCFGVQMESWRPIADLDRIKEAGFTCVRYGIGWEDIEISRGVYDWSRYDHYVKAVQDHGLRSIVILTGGHPDYTGTIDAPPQNPDGLKRYTLSPEKPEDVAAFANFAAATVKHFGSSDMLYEIWNEPDLPARFWHPKANPEAYAALASATCQAIKNAAPDAKIMGAGTAGIPGRKSYDGGGEFDAPLLKSTAASCLDAISYHAYRYSRLNFDGPKTPESMIIDNLNARKYVDALVPSNRKKLALVVSEWGYTEAMLSPERQADYVLRTYLSNLLSGVPITIWYEWGDRKSSVDSEEHYGLVNGDDSPKLALTAVQAILPQISNARFIKRMPADDPNHFLMVMQQSDGNFVLVFWVGDNELAGAANVQVGQNN